LGTINIAIPDIFRKKFEELVRRVVRITSDLSAINAGMIPTDLTLLLGAETLDHYLLKEFSSF